MNILYITSVFPRPEEGSTIYTDLACALAEAGHHLTVLVADERSSKKQGVFLSENGLLVLRVRTGKLYNVGFLRKGISTVTLSFFLKHAISRHLKNASFDLILFETPPISSYKAVAFAKKRFHADVFLMLKDIFPQNGADLGLYRKDGLIYRYFRAQEKKLYRIADRIGCMSKANMAYIQKYSGVPQDKTVLFPNTKALSPVSEKSREEIRAAYGIPADKTVFVFGGNIGIPQSPDYIISCAKALLQEVDAFFLVVGRGSHAEYVKKAMEQESRFLTLDNLKRNAYEELLSCCDVGLIFLDSRFTIPNFPSRILSYMNFSIPVIAATDDVSDIDTLIQKANCGLWCSSADTAAFYAHAKTLLASPELRNTLGKNGYRYFEANLTVQNSVNLLEHYTKKEEQP